MNKWPIERLFKRTRENGSLFFGDLTHDLLEAFKEVFWWLPRRICRLIGKLLAYIPILYNDFDWDWHFILILLKFKLKRTRECITNNDIIADAKKVSKQIKYAEDLIDQILNDDFCKEEWAAHNKKWGELHINSVSIPGSTSSRYLFNRYNVTNKTEEEQEREEFRKISSLEVKRQLAADKKLFEHLRKYYRSWWD